MGDERRDNLEQIELDTNGWYLRPAAESVGQLVVEHPGCFSAPILTSNFDPLLEVSIRRAGGNPAAIFLPADGQFTNVLLPGATKVVHFHGYWRGSDTLHTPSQLTRNRPQLKGCLRALLRETTLVVMGYGGWTDMFTRTLLEVISEQTDQLDVLWTFYSDNDEDIARRNLSLIKEFEPLAGQRVVLYKGVDCHLFLPTLREKLKLASRTGIEAPSKAFQPIVDLTISGDHPPLATNWVGREDELRIMLSSKAKLIAITGLGGNGKSTLASKYLSLKQGQRDVAMFYWADCREQGNTLFTQLVRMVERVSNGRIRGAQLQEQTAEAAVDLLLETLGATRAVFVFDNIDQYVDVEQCSAVGTMAVLLERALNRDHMAQFILTARPKLDYCHSSFLHVQLGGLSLEETRKLFDVCGVAISAAQRYDTILEVHTLTQGHPLALNIIATQVTRNKADLQELLSKIRRGVEAGVENPVLPEIWGALNAKQQTVLRYLAEQVIPETEQRIASYLGADLNYNQFSKAIRALKALNLVVVKSPGGSFADTIELHPLVRDFVRRRFPVEEQKQYIISIIHFCDRMISKFRSTILNVPYSVLENWTAKVELCMRCGQQTEALRALWEVGHSLHKNGYPEEFVRLATEVLQDFQLTQDEDAQVWHDDIQEDLATTLAELGRHQEAVEWLSRFEKAITGKTARYVLFCKAKSHVHWLVGDFSTAKKWAQQGVDLKTAANLDTKHDCAHNLALAQRDLGDVEPALKYFLAGEELSQVLAATTAPITTSGSRNGPFYGNIGRCLQLQGHFDQALLCIRQSARLIQKYPDSSTPMNYGWAAFWIGQILEKQGLLEMSYTAFRQAALTWKTPSPPRSREAAGAAATIRERLQNSSTLPADDWECQKAFGDWLKKNS